MNRQELAIFLEDIYQRYHRPEFLPTDPLAVVHRFETAEDREVAALLAAAFASGNIKSILAILDALFAVMGPRPGAWLRDHQPGDLRGRFPGLYHRWVREEDVEVLLAMIGGALRQHGSLGNLWRAVDGAEETVMPALGRFSDAIQAAPIEPLAPRKRTATRPGGNVSALASMPSILLASPARGSACKRMNLFLRWMARPADGVDLGLWTEFLSPARLVMPVDTHVLRISRKLGLTHRKVADRKAAEEITAHLRKIRPEDPCRYDFALVRAGIVEKGQKAKNKR